MPAKFRQGVKPMPKYRDTLFLGYTILIVYTDSTSMENALEIGIISFDLIFISDYEHAITIITETRKSHSGLAASCDHKCIVI